MKPTLADIARQAKVTPATMSCILSRSAHFSVSDAKREEVLAIAYILNYRPKRAARTLVFGKTSTISVVLMSMERDFTSPTFSVSLTRMIHTLWANSYSANILPVDRSMPPDQAVLQTLSESHAGGYFMPRTSLQLETLEQLYRSGTPLVSIGPAMHAEERKYVSYVEVDETTVVQELVRELVGLGHHRFCCFGADGAAAETRYRAVREALNREAFSAHLNEISYRPSGTGPLHDREQARIFAERLWSQIRRATAVICASDRIAFGLIDVLSEKGLTAGRDMTVAGADNIEANPSYQPVNLALSLTTVDRSSAQLGDAIAELLLDRIKSNDTAPSVRTVPLKMVCRKTHGPASQAT